MNSIKFNGFYKKLAPSLLLVFLGACGQSIAQNRNTINPTVSSNNTEAKAQTIALEKTPKPTVPQARNQASNQASQTLSVQDLAKENNNKLNEQSRLNLKGIGPVKVGMSIEEASKAAGVKFKQEASGGEEYGCLYFVPEQQPEDIALMVTDGKIARVEVHTGLISTVSGIKIGDPESKLYQLYPGQIESETHEYIPGGKYLFFVPKDSADKNYRIVFETDENGKITQMRSGKLPEVSYIEGCV